MSRGYDAEELFDLADTKLGYDVELGSNADRTGVVLPPHYVPGQLLTANQAERLGAQLLLAAQLHDAIAASGSGESIDDVDLTRAARRMREDASDRGWLAEFDLGQLVILWVAVGRLLDAGDLIEGDVAIVRDLRRTFECELGRRGRPVDTTG